MRYDSDIPLFDETERAGSATSVVMPNSTTESSRPSMKSQRSKSSKRVENVRPLLPVSLTNDARLSQLIEYIEPSRRRDELVITPQNIQVFLGLIEEYRRSDTLRRHGLPIRSKLLFCGPPGCGKTVTAEAFSREVGLPLLIARLDSIISSFLGETASNLRKLFEEANRTPCVLFLDEFDALARTREDNAEHNELRRVVNSLLMMVDRYAGRGFLIAATNLPQSLDMAVWRRFDEVILFEAPNERQIVELIKLKTRNFPIRFDVSKKIERLKGLSYADIERICLGAIKRSILRNSKEILETEFSLAVREEIRRQNIRTRLKGMIADNG